MTCTIVSHLGRLLNQQIKPDGVQRGIVGNIISRFETKGYKLAAMKTKQPTAELLNQHYCDLVEKPFFPKMRDYMMSGPVVCMVWEGKEAVMRSSIVCRAGLGAVGQNVTQFQRRADAYTRGLARRPWACQTDQRGFA